MDIWVSSALALAAAVIVWQAYVVGREYYLRRVRYAQAKNAAAARGKPLLVIGRPGGRVRLYGEGDVTLDLDPRVLQDCPRTGMVGDVTNMPFEDGQFGAVFCSHVLDCIPNPEDAERAYRELHRVADEVFLLATTPQNLFYRWLSLEVTVWVEERDGQLIARPHPFHNLRRRFLPASQRQ